MTGAPLASRWKAAARLAAVAVLCLSSAGCDQVAGVLADRRREAAQAKEQAGDWKAAIALYETAFDTAPRSAELHYKLGLIYDEKLKDPLSAVHHFQRCLVLDPGGPHAKDAKAFIKEAKMKLAIAAGNGMTVPQHEAVRLKNDNLALRKQVVELRAELESASKLRALALKNAGIKGGGQVQKSLVPGVRTYTVVPGDTLASISRKFYKSPARWKDIQDANFNQMQGTARLKPGMVLMIP